MSGTARGGEPEASGGVPEAAGGVPAGIEARIARLLRIGTLVSIGLLAIGSLLLVAAGISPLAPAWPPLDVAAIPADLLALRPEGFLWLGLLVTIATPLLRVITSTFGFARLGESRMVLLGVAVLVVIALAVVAGIAGG
jgi:uncharacterized membrane protein